MLAGAFILAIGILLGRLLPERRKEPRPLKSPRPVCGCTHHYSMHDPETGACNEVVNGKPLRFDRFEEPIQWEQVGCACLRYSGPEPLPTYIATEIAREAGE
jgi:hypothetical protein